MNKALILKVIGLCLVCSLITGIVVYASTPTNVMTLSGGVFPGSPDYTIYKVGSTYYAKNLNGVPDYSGAVAEDVINDALANGDSVCLSPGTYSIGDVIQINPDNFFYGFGPTSILSASTSLTELINIDSATNCTVKDMALYGNNIVTSAIGYSCNHHTIDGLYVYHFAYGIDTSGFGRVINNYVYNCSSRGINLDGFTGFCIGNYINTGAGLGISVTSAGGRCELIGNTVAYVEAQGISITTPITSRVIVDSNVVYGAGSQVPTFGIEYTGGGYATISNNQISNCSNTGMTLYNVQTGVISNNIIRYCVYYGIYLNNATYLQLSNNLVADTALLDVRASYRIADSLHNTFVNCRMFDSDGAGTTYRPYGFIEEGTSDFNTYLGCDSYTEITANKGIYLLGGDSYCHSSWNQTTWID